MFEMHFNLHLNKMNVKQDFSLNLESSSSSNSEEEIADQASKSCCNFKKKCIIF